MARRPKRGYILAATVLLILVSVTGCAGSPPVSALQNQPDLAKETTLKEAAKDYFANIPSSYNLIDGPGLKAKMEHPERIYLVDIRKPEDFAVGHILGAVNIPFNEMGQRFDSLPKDKEIIVYCYSGQTSGQAIAVLQMNGFNALSLLGGFPEWSKSFPVTK
ncbi:rhodanese-like domain-containing protein [Paradesulfitobacterium ferrireducens]|uniref:rhodanese-like domain-containing protein n=1 Tax=Paradesulfitobacterium ferrireducens TaxID=2816476 RepID=UPI001A8EE6B9|nr:rhodanese-like domain-containing protein [Paradesulfitobacterium ferrireducens]